MRFYTLQLFRFIAALLVMFHHLGGFTRSGNSGVYIFFVMSGFVIYRALFNTRKPSAPRFFIDRFTKIFFLYWFALICMYVVNPFPLTPGIMGTIFLIPNHIPFLQVSWSLTYELYFYFFTAAAAYCLKPSHARLFLLVYLVASTLTTFLYLSGLIQIKGSMINFILGKNSWNFLLGLLSGYLSNLLFASTARMRMIVPGCFFIYILLSAFFIAPSDDPFPVLVTGIVCMGLILFAAVYEKANKLPAKLAAIFGLLGDASYAIYLIAPVIGVIIRVRSAGDKVVIILVTIATAILLHRLVEIKFLHWGRKWLYKKIE